MKRKRSRLSPEVTEGSKEPTLAKVQMTLDTWVTLAGLDRAHLGGPFQSEHKAGSFSRGVAGQTATWQPARGTQGRVFAGWSEGAKFQPQTDHPAKSVLTFYLFPNPLKVSNQEDQKCSSKPVAFWRQAICLSAFLGVLSFCQGTSLLC